MSEFLAWMASLPGPALYLLLGAGSALENVVPAVPADTFVALGGILSTLGSTSAQGVFLATWLCNVASALGMYRLAHRHGGAIVGTRVGQLVLRPHQLERMARFYARFGPPAIFLTRFLPGLRAVVPVFAGITRQRWWAVALPVAVASAIWHAGLVALGVLAGRNLDVLEGLLARIQGVLGLLAGVLVVLIAIWWWRSRHPPREPGS
ncbi:MAG: DedA family protein [Gemmatimonadales bacterium]